MKKSLAIALLAMIIFSVAAVYYNSLHNPFIWDEEVIITGNPLIKELKYIPLIFKTNIFGGPLDAGGFYRPVYMLFFMFDYHFWRLNAFGYHITSIIFHIFNILLLYIVALKIGLEKRTALAASLLFALFAMNCESVTLIAARVELVLGFFLLLCIWSFLKALKQPTAYFFVTVLIFIVALYAKESSILLPFILLSYTYIFLGKDKDEKRRGVVLCFLLIGIAAIYCLMRYLFFGSSFPTMSLIKEAGILERLYTFPRILVTYIQLMLAPFSLKSEYNFVTHSFKDPYVWIGVPALVFIFWAMIKFLKPKKQTLFFIIWFFLGIIPYSNIALPLHATLMEHWGYVSSMAFAVLCSMAFFGTLGALKLKKYRYLAISIFAIAVCFNAFKIIERNNEWNDPITLYKKDVQREPQSFLLHCNLGVEYFRRGMMAEAKKEFLASNKVCPRSGYDMAYNNLGVIYARERAISARP